MMWLLVTALLIQTADFQADGVKALDAKQYAAAVDLFTKAVAADPQDYAAHFHLALAYSLLGKDAEAIAQYKAMLELKPGLYEAQLNIGICMSGAKDPALAIPALTSASEQRPKEFRPAIYLGQAQLDLGDFAAAQALFTTALSIDAASAPAEPGLGQALARQNTSAKPSRIFARPGQVDPGYNRPCWSSHAVRREHKAAAAIAIYREFPGNPAPRSAWAPYFPNPAISSDAIPALEIAVAKSPTSANRVALAQAYVKNKQPEKAIPLVTQALGESADGFRPADVLRPAVARRAQVPGC